MSTKVLPSKTGDCNRGSAVFLLRKAAASPSSDIFIILKISTVQRGSGTIGNTKGFVLQKDRNGERKVELRHLFQNDKSLIIDRPKNTFSMSVPWNNCTQEHITSTKLGHPLSTEGSEPLGSMVLSETWGNVSIPLNIRRKRKIKY